MSRVIPQVGAPDPERETSPIFDEDDEDELSLDFGIETGACYFNGDRYALGAYVASGAELLRCGEEGVWVRVGEILPEKDVDGK